MLFDFGEMTVNSYSNFIKKNKDQCFNRGLRGI